MRMKDKLFPILAELLKVECSEIKADMTAEHFANWDSLAVINIALAVESEFDLSLTPEQIALFNNVSNIIDILEQSDC